MTQDTAFFTAILVKHGVKFTTDRQGSGCPYFELTDHDRTIVLEYNNEYCVYPTQEDDSELLDSFWPEQADAWVAEVKLQEDATPDDDQMCTTCTGSGEGMYDGTRCRRCGGSGVDSSTSSDDDCEPAEPDYCDEERNILP